MIIQKFNPNSSIFRALNPFSENDPEELSGLIENEYHWWKKNRQASERSISANNRYRTMSQFSLADPTNRSRHVKICQMIDAQHDAAAVDFFKKISTINQEMQEIYNEYENAENPFKSRVFKTCIKSWTQEKISKTEKSLILEQVPKACEDGDAELVEALLSRKKILNKTIGMDEELGCDEITQAFICAIQKERIHIVQKIIQSPQFMTVVSCYSPKAQYDLLNMLTPEPSETNARVNLMTDCQLHILFFSAKKNWSYFLQQAQLDKNQPIINLITKHAGKFLPQAKRDQDQHNIDLAHGKSLTS